MSNFPFIFFYNYVGIQGSSNLSADFKNWEKVNGVTSMNVEVVNACNHSYVRGYGYVPNVGVCEHTEPTKQNSHPKSEYTLRKKGMNK